MKDDARIAGEFEQYKKEKEKEVESLKARITVLEADLKEKAKAGPHDPVFSDAPEPEPTQKKKAKGAKKD